MLCIAAAAWYMGPFRQWVDHGRLLAVALQLRQDPAAAFYVVAVYIIGGLLSFPIVILIPATAVIFGILPGACYAAMGLMVNALLLYGIGHVLGHDAVHRLAGSRMHCISVYLAKQGLLTIAVLRLLPVAPYSIVNLAAGASHIGLRAYILGTILGLLPAIVIMSIVGNGLTSAPVWALSGNMACLMAIACLALLAAGMKRIWHAVRCKKLT